MTKRTDDQRRKHREYVRSWRAKKKAEEQQRKIEERIKLDEEILDLEHEKESISEKIKRLKQIVGKDEEKITEEFLKSIEGEDPHPEIWDIDEKDNTENIEPPEIPDDLEYLIYQSPLRWGRKTSRTVEVVLEKAPYLYIDGRIVPRESYEEKKSDNWLKIVSSLDDEDEDEDHAEMG